MQSNYAWLNWVSNNSLKCESWHEEKVVYFDIRKVVLSKTFGYAYINARDIKGISHEGYANESSSCTWSELLERLSRFDRFRTSPTNRSKEDIIRVIHSEEVFPPDYKRVYEWNGAYYISTGHHRLTVAKFLDVENIKVMVSHVETMNE